MMAMLAIWYCMCLLLLRQRRIGTAGTTAAPEELANVVDAEGAASELSTFTRENERLRDTTSWLVQLDLGGEELEIAIAKTRQISDAQALRCAIADACIASQGVQNAPRRWKPKRGRMQIQYLDNEDELKTLASPTDFRDVCKSLRLHVMPT